jgi:P4 family phage/plasmid primase-like protien
MSPLPHLLARFRVEKGYEFTHTSLGRPAGSYYITGSSYDAFIEAYKSAIAAGEDVHMTERHRHIGPVVCDLDFRFDGTSAAAAAADAAIAAVTAAVTAAATANNTSNTANNTNNTSNTSNTASAPVITAIPHPPRRHSRESVRRMVHVMCRAVSALVDVDTFDCYVTEKPHASVFKGMVKDGLHLTFPTVVTRPEVQHIMRQDALAPLKAVLAEELPTLINSVEDVLDEAVIERNNWMMYGSKKPGGAVYAVTARYRYTAANAAADTPDALVEVAQDAGADYVTLLSIRNKYEDVPVRESQTERVESFIARVEEEHRRREVVAAVMSSSPNPTSNTCDDLESVVQMVAILAMHRVDNYNDWVRLGWCLRNIDYRLLDTWIDISRRSPKYVEGECPRLWNAMRAGGLGIGTLHMWARHDSPEQYREILRAGLAGFVEDSVDSATHYDVARVVYHLFRYQYVCCNIRNRTWYEFKDHRWRECESGYSLRARLSTDVFKEYQAMHKRVEDLLERTNAEARLSRGERLDEAGGSSGMVGGRRVADDPAVVEERTNLKNRIRCLEKRVKKTTDLALKLKISSFKDNVLKECGELFYHEKFENKLNSNLDLLGFENGVLDLVRMEFREGRPDDYVSFTTGINYVPYAPAHPVMIDIMRFWESVHTDPSIRDYVLMTLAACLSGRIREERFHIWTGSGANGKSLTVTLFEKTLGEYCCKFPVTLLTQRRTASSSATPEIARAKGRRFAVLQEPSEDERLNVGQLKELSGGDVVQTRELFKAPCEWKPQFKLFLLCNQLPHVPSDDGGTWRRIRVVEFGSKFVDNPNPDNPREFPVDMDLGSRIDSWKEHFMALLVERYKAYVTAPLREPEPVMACTREYQRTNDHLADFVDSCIERGLPTEAPVGSVLGADDAPATMCLDAAFAEYKEWAKNENVPALQQRIKKVVLQKYLERVIGRPSAASGTADGASGAKSNSVVWKGVRIINRWTTGTQGGFDA